MSEYLKREMLTFNQDKEDTDISISCISFNHGKYLRQTFDSFLSQKFTGKIEILIHDDCSTDDSVDIIREYCDRFPDIFRPMFEEENQFSKGIANISGAFNFPRAVGKYIAFCEGDDYYVDDNKLKKQFDYMEAYPECMLCCHSAKVHSMDDAYRSYDLIRPYKGSHTLTSREVISHNIIIPSASMFFRAKIGKELPHWYHECQIGDAPQHLFALMNGDLYYMDEPMSAYRMGTPGSWTAGMNNSAQMEKWEKYYSDMEIMYGEFNKDTDGRYQREVEEALARIRFFTDIKEGRLGGVNDRKNEVFLRELPRTEETLLKLRAKYPKLYGLMQNTWHRMHRN